MSASEPRNRAERRRSRGRRRRTKVYLQWKRAFKGVGTPEQFRPSIPKELLR